MMMKILLRFLFVMSLLMVSARGYAQDAPVSLRAENMPLEQVFTEIEKQTNVKFFYRSENVAGKTASVNVAGIPLKTVLKSVLTPHKLKYSLMENSLIVIEPEIGKAAADGAGAVITETVTDPSGQPLAGAAIAEKGTTNGAVSDAAGKFSLKVAKGARVVVSYLGYLPQEFVLGNQRELKIALEEDNKALDEVVVVGYGMVSRKNLTTAISKVSPANIAKAANSNMSQLLLGQAAGLQATVSSAQPGGNVNISIRGAGTPIYIVDGVMVPSGSLEPGTSNMYTPASIDRAGLAGLNPQDIESIEVLKDASASIYGIGAANGVILITTKKGKEGRLKVSYEGNVSTVRNYSFPEALDAQQYMTNVNLFNKELYLFNNRLAPYGPNTYTSGWSPVFSSKEISEAQTTDWKDYVLRNGSISNHTLTVNGGTKSINYYVSGNYFNQVGQMVNSNMERYALKSTFGAQLASFIKLSVGMNVYYNTYLNSTVGANGGNNGGGIAGALRAARIYPSNLPVRDEDGEYTVHAKSFAPNPVSLGEIDDVTNSNGSYLNFSTDVDIIKNMLSARLLYGNNLEQSNRSVYIPSYVWFYQKYSSRGNLVEDKRMNQTMEATLMFNKKFFDAVNMDVLLGAGRYLNHSNGMTQAYDGQQYDAIGNDNISSATGAFYPYSYRYDDEKRSQFFRANFDVLDRYVVAGTLRRDGTDKFFPGKKYAWFPAVSLAWKISNEAFLRDVTWINLLKVRASYGQTGSDNLGTLLYGSYGPGSIYVIFNNGTSKYMPIVEKGMDYPDVTWQKTTMRNVGLDFYLFNDRLSGSFDLFRNDITDLLGDATTQGLSMFSTYPINGGHTRREGWDASIQSKNIVGQDFSWTTVVTLSKYKYWWMERFPNYDYKPYESRGKETVNTWYYYETNGIVNADKSNMPSSQPVAAQMPGYPVIVDKNGDGSITYEDIVLQDNTPTLYWGLGNTFKYRDFDLNIFLYSQLGVWKYNDALDWAYANAMATQGSNANHYIQRVWNSQTNPNGTLPGIAADLAPVSLPEGVGTDIRMQDASFVRVRNITLGYTVGGAKLGVVGKAISSFRVYFDAQNPLTFTRFEGYDPETKAGVGELPNARIYSVGINLSF
jgi:TonB-linked SusC/RagA family outer membrane protein